MTTDVEKGQTSLNPTEETKPAKQIQITAKEQAKLDKKLLAAASYGDQKRIDKFIKRGANPNVVNKYGASAVQLFLRWGKVWGATLLADNGATIDEEDKKLASRHLARLKIEIAKEQEAFRNNILAKYREKRLWEQFIERER